MTEQSNPAPFGLKMGPTFASVRVVRQVDTLSTSTVQATASYTRFTLRKQKVSDVLEEIHEMEDWVPLAGALGAVGINSNKATRDDVLSLVTDIFEDDRVYIGTIEPGPLRTYLTPIPGSTSADKLVKTIFSSTDPSGDMMTYFVAENED